MGDEEGEDLQAGTVEIVEIVVIIEKKGFSPALLEDGKPAGI